MTRSQTIRIAAIVHLPALLVAAVATLVVAAVASRWFPVGHRWPDRPRAGPAAHLGRAHPHGRPGDGPGGRRGPACRRRGRKDPGPARAGGRPAAWMQRVSPVPLGLGCTMALKSGRGRARVPVRQALVGAMVGIFGVVATMTINAGLQDAVDHPERAGVAWDAAVVPGAADLQPDGIDPGFVEAVSSVDEVAGASVVDRLSIAVDGVGVPGYAVRPSSGQDTPDIELVLLNGRTPDGDDELALGPATLRDLDLEVGDRVEVGEGGLPMTVVGEALFPSDVHAAFDEGAWVATAGWDEVVPPFDSGAGTGPERSVAVRFDAGVDPEDGVEALGAGLGDRASGVSAVEVPLEIENLGNVRTLPTVLAVFLGLLAVAAVGHVLFTSARRRAPTFAVLRALGLTRRGARSVLNSQGTIIGLVGLAFGVPIGIVIGRWGWSYVAGQVPLEDVPPSAGLAVVVVVPVALLLANALAVWPGRRVARMRPADVLRARIAGPHRRGRPAGSSCRATLQDTAVRASRPCEHAISRTPRVSSSRSWSQDRGRRSGREPPAAGPRPRCAERVRPGPSRRVPRPRPSWADGHGRPTSRVILSSRRGRDDPARSRRHRLRAAA